MSKTVSVTQVQICLLTYRRPDLLRQTLQSLLAQTALSDPGIVVHILVIDNHDAHSGRPVFDEVLASSPIPARYICEPARGLSIARNRALEESAGMDYAAFIDDDEMADPDWLERLLEAARKYDAAVVTGPVWPRHQQSPDWVVRGGFFAAARKPTGTEVGCVATNNVLLRADIVAAFRFDGRFDSTGGEDTEYSMRIKHAGNRMVWVNEAIVSESIPPSRASARWLLSRARSDANRYTRGCLSVDSGLRTVGSRLAIACGGFLAGLSLLPLGLLGRQHSVRALQLMSRSVGTVSALLGREQIFYGPSHG
jgi:glycosyltransferase involved in cell wall biosynthesis